MIQSLPCFGYGAGWAVVPDSKKPQKASFKPVIIVFPYGRYYPHSQPYWPVCKQDILSLSLFIKAILHTVL